MIRLYDGVSVSQNFARCQLRLSIGSVYCNEGTRQGFRSSGRHYWRFERSRRRSTGVHCHDKSNDGIVPMGRAVLHRDQRFYSRCGSEIQGGGSLI